MVAIGPAPSAVNGLDKAQHGQSQTQSTQQTDAAQRGDEPPAHEIQRYCTDDKTRNDCIIQLRTALATEQQSRWALAGLWLIGATAVAAFATVWIMMRTGQRQLRAYVVVSGGHMRRYQSVANGNSIMQIVVQLKNCGQTPGYDFSTWADKSLCVPDLVEFTDAPPPERRNGISIIGAGSTADITLYIEVTQSDLTNIRPGTPNRLIVWGRADYTDIFKRQRYIEFRCENGTQMGEDAYAIKPHKSGYRAN